MVRRSLSLIAVASLLAAPVAFSQTSSQPNSQAGGNPPAQRRPIPPPTNLKVLPKDTTGPQVIAIMRGIHRRSRRRVHLLPRQGSRHGRPNFASDANPMKDRARVMIKMTNTINTEYLTQLTDPKPENPVTCGTCHRGMAQPPVFVPPPREHQQPRRAAATHHSHPTSLIRSLCTQLTALPLPRHKVS